MTAVFRHVVLAELEIEEGAPAEGGADDHISPMAAVAAVRSPAGDELLPPEADAAAPTVARLDVNLRFVDEFHLDCLCLFGAEGEEGENVIRLSVVETAVALLRDGIKEERPAAA